MRSLVGLLLTLGVGAAVAFHVHAAYQPSWISGTVVNWSTGRPVPNESVLFKEPNGAREATHTDSQGRFRVAVPAYSEEYRLYVGAPRFGLLLQSKFGRSVIVYNGGEQHSGVVIPAIPSTYLAGHVYEGNRTPVANCEVLAFTESFDDSGSWSKAASATTDRAGAFSFDGLGSDRYFLAARCHKYSRVEGLNTGGSHANAWKPRRSWPVTLFPQATTRDRAEAIVLYPGSRRTDIRFHLRTTLQYSIQGSVTRSDGSKPSIYSSPEVKAFAISSTPASVTPSGEVCDWDRNASNRFICDFLSAGFYRLRFFLQDSSEQREESEATAQVPSRERTTQELRIRLHRVDTRPDTTVNASPLGNLNIKRVCASVPGDSWINVMAWGPAQRNLADIFNLRCLEKITGAVPAGKYTISVYERTFFSGSQVEHKVENLLRRHGEVAMVRERESTEVTVPVWTTEKIIKRALESLREPRSIEK